MGNEWETKALKEVGKIVSGATPKTNVLEYWDGSISWVTPKDLGKIFGQKYIIETTRSITELGLKSCSAQLMPKGSIIMSSRAPIGHLAIAIHDLCTNQGCKSIVPNDNMVSEYIYYYLLSNRDKLNKLGKGAVFPELSGKLFGDFKIPIPSFEDQQKIVEKLDKAFELIDQAKANIEQNIINAKELFQSKLDEVFSQKGDGWTQCKFKDVLDIINGRNQKEVESSNGEYPIYGSAGKVMGYATSFLCNENTIIIGRKGTIDNPIFIDHKFWNVDTAFGLKSKGVILDKLLYYFTKTIDFKSMDKGTTLPSLTKKDLLEIEINFPSDLNIQNVLVLKLDDLSSMSNQTIDNYRKKLSNLEELRKSILEKAFKGELTN